LAVPSESQKSSRELVVAKFDAPEDAQIEMARIKERAVEFEGVKKYAAAQLALELDHCRAYNDILRTILNTMTDCLKRTRVALLEHKDNVDDAAAQHQLETVLDDIRAAENTMKE
jgi:hypothetical protein